MSTRATYQFKSQYKPTITVYIHHDGYLEGAAEYFRAALDFTGGTRVTPESMIRANERAEITTNHEEHTDSEFRYTMTDGHKLQALARGGDEWKVVFEGTVQEFIDEYDASSQAA